MFSKLKKLGSSISEAVKTAHDNTSEKLIRLRNKAADKLTKAEREFVQDNKQEP